MTMDTTGPELEALWNEAIVEDPINLGEVNPQAIVSCNCNHLI